MKIIWELDKAGGVLNAYIFPYSMVDCLTIEDKIHSHTEYISEWDQFCNELEEEKKYIKWINVERYKGKEKVIYKFIICPHQDIEEQNIHLLITEIERYFDDYPCLSVINVVNQKIMKEEELF